MFNCKTLFKLQIRPPSLILLITASQDRWIFPSQSWVVRNSMIIINNSNYMRTEPFWAITQRVMVIPYRRFGATYRSHIEGTKIQEGCFLDSKTFETPDMTQSSITTEVYTCVITSFRHAADENCSLLSYNAACSGSFFVPKRRKVINPLAPELFFF